jgi:hypothetical protein
LVILAFVAGPPSPENPLEPLPAVVVIRDATRYGADSRFVPGPPLGVTTHVPRVRGWIWKVVYPCTSGRGDGSVSPGSLVVMETVSSAPGATLKKSSTAKTLMLNGTSIAWSSGVPVIPTPGSRLCPGSSTIVCDGDGVAVGVAVIVGVGVSVGVGVGVSVGVGVGVSVGVGVGVSVGVGVNVSVGVGVGVSVGVGVNVSVGVGVRVSVGVGVAVSVGVGVGV